MHSIWADRNRCGGIDLPFIWKYFPPVTTTAFNQKQFQNPYPDDIQYHYWSLARHRIIYRHLQPLVHGRQDLILDVGCGRGMAVQWLRDRGLDAIGCDPGTPAPFCSEVSGFLHLGVEAGALTEDISRRVRIILLLDVLEHLAEPGKFLCALLKKFRNCRHVLFTVPAREELWSNYDEYYGHKLRYDRPAVKGLADESGGTLERSGYFFHSLWIPARIMISLARKRSTEIHPPGPRMRWLHRTLAVGFALEELVIPQLWVGTSILGVLDAHPLKQIGEDVAENS